jgi:formylglycine-generating enzyme required for sulfatase activity
VGLIPLGPDKDSELEEFYETETGDAPQRDEKRKIIVTENMAMVFVLIPSGAFWMGAQNEDMAEPNYDPECIYDERPEHKVTLSAFFLSKYEMTQGQWVRTSKGDRPNPSEFVKAGYEQWEFGKVFDLRLPVERVSWDDSHERLRRLGYSLPTEAQWEYACRSETETPWSSGEEAKSLEKCGNVADRSRKILIGGECDITIDDEFPATSAVGTFLANRFGLHDMHGNVFEWCEDAFGDYSTAPHREGDGLREIPGEPIRVYRGGSFHFPPQKARSAYRDRHDPSIRLSVLGLRASRRVTTP